MVVEALNSHDSPRAALVSSGRALEVINLVRAQAGVTNVGFLADLYHLGKIGCEYKPSDPADSSTSFGWREPDGV